MRVVKKPKAPKIPKRSVYPMRLDNDLMDALAKLAEDHGISRTRLIEEILKKALTDKSFVLEIET